MFYCKTAFLRLTSHALPRFNFIKGLNESNCQKSNDNPTPETATALNFFASIFFAILSKSIFFKIPIKRIRTQRAFRGDVGLIAQKKDPSATSFRPKTTSPDRSNIDISPSQQYSKALEDVLHLCENLLPKPILRR